LSGRLPTLVRPVFYGATMGALAKNNDGV